MTIKSKLKTFFFLDDEYDDNNDDYAQTVEPAPVKQKQQHLPVVKNQNVVSLQSVQKTTTSSKSSKVILVEPRTYSESTDIADHLKNRRAVVVNLQRIDNEQGRQIVDFLSGVVYALGGDIQKIGLSIFLCTPDNVEVSGNISDLIPDFDNQNTRW
ncbi:cell division protein SepF [Bacillus sp. ISL-40]|uniref:cell division protein SepF n=1 Tax=unclassified Bacillus (in: firmicutes) TaxID=185979 RepID=UPI001BE64DFD|nr:MULTISPECIES: cell division protein SepF [unclassified Bacillus (in: firmicutes)]MBT2697750.1 cell division protein SepF [Bacillus sp. ISL-40]MBT2722575.1 cell division protein SepF [Bacillus sp. ISL-46]MBT2740159.1 cell division protein SepF [Bacillus sp. ISL-77]